MLIVRNNSRFETTVYRKATNTDIYLHWSSFAPLSWKRGTLQTLFDRALTICSTKEYLSKEIDHLYRVFRTNNGYPKWFIDQVYKKSCRRKTSEDAVITTTDSTAAESDVKTPLLILPYAGNAGEKIIKSLQNHLSRKLPENVKPKIIYTGTKLQSKFNLKDGIPSANKHGVIYKVKCANENCDEFYIGETGRRLWERVKDHNGRDHNSHVLQHASKKSHENVGVTNFEIIGGNFRNKRLRLISEALLIKKFKPPLNVQGKSVPLQLFS